jgi:hypothetical protein
VKGGWLRVFLKEQTSGRIVNLLQVGATPDDGPQKAALETPKEFSVGSGDIWVLGMAIIPFDPSEDLQFSANVDVTSAIQGGAS